MGQQHIHLQGSVLVFTLLVLSLLLSVTLSAAGVVVTEKNSSSATQKSALAFQVADGAAEKVLKRIYKDADPTLDGLAVALTPEADVRDGQLAQIPIAQIPQCVNGAISVASMPELEVGKYSVSFFDANSQLLECSGPGYSTNAEWRTKVARIVSVGTYNGVTRAIDTTIRPAPCGGTATVDDADGNSYDAVEIGNQCWMQQNMRVGTTINSSTLQTDNSGTNIIEKYCYGNNASNCTSNHPNEPDGGLYEWDEAMQYDSDVQGICPGGWHIPTDSEWYTLEDYLKNPGETCDASRSGAGCDRAGMKLQPIEAGCPYVEAGTSGFEGNRAGFFTSGVFNDRGGACNVMPAGGRAYYWTSTPEAGGRSYARVFQAASFQISRIPYEDMALSVRCIKD